MTVDEYNYYRHVKPSKLIFRKLSNYVSTFNIQVFDIDHKIFMHHVRSLFILRVPFSKVWSSGLRAHVGAGQRNNVQS